DPPGPGVPRASTLPATGSISTTKHRFIQLSCHHFGFSGTRQAASRNDTCAAEYAPKQQMVQPLAGEVNAFRDGLVKADDYSGQHRKRVQSDAVSSRHRDYAMCFKLSSCRSNGRSGPKSRTFASPSDLVVLNRRERRVCRLECWGSAAQARL